VTPLVYVVDAAGVIAEIFVWRDSASAVASIDRGDSHPFDWRTMDKSPAKDSFETLGARQRVTTYSNRIQRS
jgi:hypothetical protein